MKLIFIYILILLLCTSIGIALGVGARLIITYFFYDSPRLILFPIMAGILGFLEGIRILRE